MNPLTQTMDQAVSFGRSAGAAVGFSAAGLSMDTIVIIVIFAILGIYGLYFGKRRLVAFILSFYPAALLFQSFPYFRDTIIGSGNAQSIILTRTAFFLAAFVICNIAVGGVLRGDFSFSRTSKFFEVAILAVSATILVLVFAAVIVPFDAVYAFSSPISGLFSGQTGLFWGLLAPLVGLYIGNRFG